MSTPERPSLADTIAHIDAVLAEPVAKPPCLQCVRQAMLGSPFCAAHGPYPVVGEYLSGLPLDVRPPRCRCVVTPIEPVVRDGDTFTINKPGVYQFGGEVRRQLFEQAATRVAADRRIETATAPRTPEPGPGWLGRLRRLFT